MHISINLYYYRLSLANCTFDIVLRYYHAQFYQYFLLKTSVHSYYDHNFLKGDHCFVRLVVQKNTA